jgi:hypothetical protein
VRISPSDDSDVIAELFPALQVIVGPATSKHLPDPGHDDPTKAVVLLGRICHGAAAAWSSPLLLSIHPSVFPEVDLLNGVVSTVLLDGGVRPAIAPPRNESGSDGVEREAPIHPHHSDPLAAHGAVKQRQPNVKVGLAVLLAFGRHERVQDA